MKRENIDARGNGKICPQAVEKSVCQFMSYDIMRKARVDTLPFDETT